MRRILRHLTAWLHRRRLDDELRDEMAQHVVWKAEGLMAEGVPEIEARRRAAVEIGNLTRLREESRAIWGFPSVDSLVQDARYGWRQLRRTPVFTLATVTTLALTIGATSALFAIANAVLLRPLPYPRSDRIVSISIVRQGTDTRLMDEPTARLALESALPSFESLALYDTTGANFSGGVCCPCCGATVSMAAVGATRHSASLEQVAPFTTVTTRASMCAVHNCPLFEPCRIHSRHRAT